MVDSTVGFVDDYEWKVCWDFKKDIGWSPETDTVFPPSPWKSKSESSGAWKGNSTGRKGGRQRYGQEVSAVNVTGGGMLLAPPGYPQGPPHGRPSDAPPFPMLGGDMWHPPSSAFSPSETPAPPWWFAPPPPPPPPQPQCQNDGIFGGSFGSTTTVPRWQGDVNMGNDERGCVVEEEWWANKNWNVEEENEERAGCARSGKSHSTGAGIAHSTAASVSRAAPRDKKASNSRGRGSGGSGDADVDRENAENVPVPGGARGGRSAKWQPKSVNGVDVKARGGVAAAIDALLEQVGPTLQKTDFDNRVRRTLSAILASGGLEQVQDALEWVRAAVAHKPRDSVRNWSGYLVTLVKTFDSGAKQPLPQAGVAGGKGAGSNESAKASHETPPEQTAAAVAARVLRESRAARPNPALSSTSWAAVDQEERGVAVAAVTAPSQSSEVVTSQTAATSQSPPLGSPEHAEEEVDDWPVRKAIRQGNLLEALDLVSMLPMVTARVAERVLSALGRTPALGEDVMDKLMDLAGRFSASAFDAAASEAHQRGDALACYQLYQVAGLLCVPKTVEALTHLLLGQVSDPVRARSIVEQLLSEDSDVTLTQDFAEALVAVCAAADDTDLAAAVFEKATAHGITVDMPATARKS